MLTVKATAFDVPPPGAGFVTVTLGVPDFAMSAAGTVTVIVAAVIVVGVSAGLEPKFTVVPETKFVPVMVNTNDAPPAVALAGESGGVIVGTGLLTVKT